MNFNTKKTLAILGFTIGIFFIILTLIADIFLIVGLLIIGLSFIIFDKYMKEKKNQDNKKSELEKKNDTTQFNNYELSSYKELISNDFSIENIDSNFKSSLVLMALNQIKENAYFNPNDLPFNIDERILQIDKLGRNLFLQSKYKSFIALDTETTGLSCQTDRIIQIALIKIVNGEIVDKFTTFVNPQRHISYKASEINNIYDNDVQNAKTIKELFPAILEFIGKYPIVMHNAKFDMSFLKEEYYRSFGQEMPKLKYICTMKLWRKLFLKYQGEDVPSSKLNTLVLNLLNTQEYNDYQNDKHSAECDAIATSKVFMKMYDDTISKT